LRAGHDQESDGVVVPCSGEVVSHQRLRCTGAATERAHNSSVIRQVIERLCGNSLILNEHGQYTGYGKVGGVL
jgi:hypothetical protein